MVIYPEAVAVSVRRAVLSSGWAIIIVAMHVRCLLSNVSVSPGGWPAEPQHSLGLATQSVLLGEPVAVPCAAGEWWQP